MKTTCLLLFAWAWTSLYTSAWAKTTAPALTCLVTPEQSRLHPSAHDPLVIEIKIRGCETIPTRRLPLNLAVVLDRSGSMEGSKLEKARQAAAYLARQIGRNDRYALVTYDDQTEVLIPSTPGHHLQEFIGRIAGIRCGGSTALYDGLVAGAEQVRNHASREYLNRVLLLSDGLANVGPSSPRDLAGLARELRSENLSISTIGVGDDYNEDLMVAVAEASHANYYYVQDVESLPSIFAKELNGLQSIVARDIRIVIEAQPGFELIEVIGYPESTPHNNRITFTLPDYTAGQERDFYVRCRPAKAGNIKNVSVLKTSLAWKTSADEDASGAWEAAVVPAANSREAKDSLNTQVYQARLLVENRLSREKALELADAGRTDEAVQELQRQRTANAAAPAAVSGSAALKEENRYLESSADTLAAQGEFKKDQRKSFQYRNYNDKYQK
jgi:Ca-activated chloride channel family protein